MKIILISLTPSILKRGLNMKINWMYRVFLIITGAVSFFTGEIITFVMLLFIFFILNDIHLTLQKIYIQNKEKSNQE